MVTISNPSKYTAEFIGTYVLTFTVGCNVLTNDAAFGALSIASTLMVLIYAFGNISGGHFNPAVSFGVALADEKFSWGHFAAYSFFQLLGAMAAAGSYTLCFGKTFQVAPVAPFTWFECCWVELLYTGFLVFCVLNTAVAKKNQNKEFGGLTIGFSIVAGGFATAAISGGCLNPAVALAADIISWGHGWSLAFTLSQLIGAACAVMLYHMIRPEEFGTRYSSSVSDVAPKLISEFFGTFMLVFTVGLNVCAAVNQFHPAALSIAAALMCSIYCVGDVSGGHLNPAVTVAVYARDAFFGDKSAADSMSFKDAASYIVAQICGGLVAGFAFGLTCKELGSGFDIGPSGGFTWWNVFFSEAIFTAVLAFTVLSCCTTKTCALDNLHGLAIGFCVIVGGYAVGPISGGHLNPAVSMGASFANLAFRHGNFWRCLVYAAAQVTGGVAAVATMAISHGDEVFGEQKRQIPA
jgi:aquaporin Z